FKGEPQIPSMEFPNISVVFLDKTYKPKTSSEVNKMITDIENVYNEESNAKLGQGETKPDTNLMRQKDKAIAELKKVRPHLVRYEEILQEQGNIENNNQKAKANADVIIMETTKMFGGSVDLVPLFLENFIYTNLRDWKYYPTGAELMGVKFHIPVIYNVRSDIAYDARPETFGNPQVVIVEMFGGNEHLASLFLKTFPKDNIRDWKYYPLGANLMDIDFQIPVIHNTKTGAVYDARLETFGKILVKANK
ncbi:MAG: hypothetical protein J6S61_00545, partial [Elusimicrobiaceae bacterium]|nr:hypothetical protein [Elusimicrobiaceae bacterium]